MPNDDPDALEVVLKYLYSLSPDCVVIDPFPIKHMKLPTGYLAFCVEVFRLAQKYSLDLLAEHVADHLTHPIRCWECQTSPIPDVDTAELGSCINVIDYPIELLGAIALAEDLEP